MGLLDFFKKKKEQDYDATNIRLTDLKRGYIFDYDLSTWKVDKSYDYDWGGNFFTVEHQISNGRDTLYLSISEDDELELSVSSKIKISSIEQDIPSCIKNNEEPPSKIVFKGESYSMESGSSGFIRTGDSDDWQEMMSWDYYNNEGDKILCIEQFDDNEFEASYGVVAKEFEFSNILPA